ncbi:ATP:cob(I)alamin adenosyltransferase [Candidatus Berkelbacteria bacterium RIFCSPLOWO2_01_FULL_50_28]|uniref:Corrinoid adenosyltransferase n=1 Tax=Candidatus Berkelbacteria bacterium RIFCSPLOWO2_01_FULL_50_28 TaxID=1797471 RepID=A0A1F5EBP0_9BACT|nr:MAG: ATP:cob(I)alamin adenosyltransferase [Candidatus Berkelbacteria bacterium RIFCSPHIGHO2_01_FULL_50_36]OGD63241.1 MAG: ATP:cob(I)alamin adenosyltransferase [Candidatus Berkelbacteria bacterium RIFCSPHIGHO2_12_FULL_50_11]OGD64828.1 MAG: ATP:cob(I)alamin adenosyltransferase [Candidatus Berkelbacteria bacterium RIFCSPLOWO2_01_FULL_50_28]
MPIYTKKGDDGTTGLPGKRRVRKDDPLIETLGSLDSSNASIGVAITAISGKSELPNALRQVQRDLLSIGAQLAAADGEKLEDSWLDRRTSEMESTIDRWDKALPPLANFILPGGSAAGASIHLARTFVRTAERNLNHLDSTNGKILRYINRLSDFLFQAARFANYSTGNSEEIWQYGKKSS